MAIEETEKSKKLIITTSLTNNVYMQSTESAEFQPEFQSAEFQPGFSHCRGSEKLRIIFSSNRGP